MGLGGGVGIHVGGLGRDIFYIHEGRHPDSFGPALAQISVSFGLVHFEWSDNLFLFNMHIKIDVNIINMGEALDSD